MVSHTTCEPVTNDNEQTARVCYLIQEADSNTFKVGVTQSMKTLKRRLRNLRTGNWRLLSVAHLFQFTEDGQAYRMEQDLLLIFADRRPSQDSEWLLNITLAELIETATNLLHLRS